MLALKWVSRYSVATNCLSTVKAITQNICLNNYLSYIIQPCSELLYEQKGIRLSYEGRGANSLTDSLAREAKGKTDGFDIICNLSYPSSACMDIYIQ